MNHGRYWLTVAQAALELKVSIATVRWLIRAGKLSTLEGARRPGIEVTM